MKPKALRRGLATVICSNELTTLQISWETLNSQV